MCMHTDFEMDSRSDIPQLYHWEFQTGLMSFVYKQIDCIMVFSPKFNHCIFKVTAIYILYHCVYIYTHTHKY